MKWSLLFRRDQHDALFRLSHPGCHNGLTAPNLYGPYNGFFITQSGPREHKAIPAFKKM